MSFNFHPFFNRLRAGGDEAVTPLDFNNAHPARTRRGKFLHPAERWYNNSVAIKGRKDCFALFGFDLFIIYLYRKKHKAYLTFIALNLHISKQIPQPIHFSSTIKKG